ncbi:MAG TPA: imidazolonepropionase, partial [Pirellulales bacterium]
TNCSQILTLAGPARPRVNEELKQLSILTDGAMLIRDGKVAAVDNRSALEPQFPAGCPVVDAGRRVVLPGFVDAHTHPVFAATRVDEFEHRAAGSTYEQIAAAGGGIRSTVRKTRAASEDELFETARRYSQWFLRTGTTTLEGKSGYGLSLVDELKMLRVVRHLNQFGPLRYVPTFLGAHEIPDDYRGRTAEYVDLVIHDMLPAVAAEELAKYCDVFCEPRIFDVAASSRILQAARQQGFGLRVHADQLSCSGASQMAAALGATTADHLEQIDESGIAALAARNVQPVLLPASVYTLGCKRFAPARAMIAAGLPIVLATDFNPGSSPIPSIPLVLSMASTQMGMTPAEAITAATINAAHSLGLGAEIGSLEHGKQADFVIHDCQDYREIAYFAGIESAASVYIGGRLVYER